MLLTKTFYLNIVVESEKIKWINLAQIVSKNDIADTAANLQYEYAMHGGIV